MNKKIKFKVSKNFNVDKAIQEATDRGYKLLDEKVSKTDIAAAFHKVYDKVAQGRNVVGRFYVNPGKKHMELRQQVTNLWVWESFWDAFYEEELNGDLKVEACFVPFNAEETGLDPILFALDLPFDDYANKQYHEGKYQDTQMGFVNRVLAESKADLEAGDQNDFLNMWLDECSGEVSPDCDEFLLNRGYARVPRMGRKSVDGYSCVGNVDSNKGQPYLSRGDGSAYGDCGVFFRAGVEICAPKLTPATAKTLTSDEVGELLLTEFDKYGIEYKRCRPQAEQCWAMIVSSGDVNLYVHHNELHIGGGSFHGIIMTIKPETIGHLSDHCLTVGDDYNFINFHGGGKDEK